jgi:GNAT superfamily N-acetyltransferase
MRSIRRATIADFGSIRAMDEWKQATEAVIAAGECHIALDGDSVLAYGILDRSFFHRAWIAILFVAPSHRRQGAGDALLDHMERVCGEKRIWTSTELPNLPMQSLLKKRGYHLTGVVENLQKNPELFYYKNLTT